MLSILIPIYNTKIVQLVDELIDQCQKAKTVFEIICLDDGSQEKFKKHNREVNARFGVNYVELTNNIGRAKIRNRLAKLARHESLIFLDGDSKIRHKKFIKLYLQHLDLNEGVCIGGTRYKKQPPTNQNKLLHWYYGSRREAISAKQRNKHPARYFHSNNFLIPRMHILQCPFPENIKGYGYEDLALGHQLDTAGIDIIHIDNPVVHLGLKPYNKFMSDQKLAIKNLAELYLSKRVVNTRLIKYYEMIKRTGLLKFVIRQIQLRKLALENHLLNNPKRLRSLDLLKLLYFDEALKNTHTKANS